MKKMKPFGVEVKSTLGAGDTFKAGCIYGLLHHMSDDENPPTLDEVNSLLREEKL